MIKLLSLLWKIGQSSTTTTTTSKLCVDLVAAASELISSVRLINEAAKDG